VRPLARNADPDTSHAAGRSARKWSVTHRDQILGVLWRPMIAAEIAKFTGLTVVQVDRRMPELEQDAGPGSRWSANRTAARRAMTRARSWTQSTGPAARLLWRTASPM